MDKVCRHYDPRKNNCKNCPHRPINKLEDNSQLIQSIEKILDFQWDAERNHWIEENIVLISDEHLDLFVLYKGVRPDTFFEVFDKYPETKGHYFYHLVILKQFLNKLKS